jgi:hypothetical protein
MTLHSRWRWGSRQHATAVRTVVLAIWLAIVAITPYGYYARFPAEMSAGYGLGRLLLGGHALKAVLLSYPVLMALKWGAMAACVLAILFPNRCRWLTPVVLAFVFVLDNLTKSFNGYVNHAQLVPFLILVVFAVFGGRRYLPTLGFHADDGDVTPEPETSTLAADATVAPYGSVVWLAGLMLIIPYTFIAMNRLLVGGFEVFHGDALLDYINLTSRRYSVYHSSVFLGLIRIWWLAAALKVGYFVTTLFELGSAGALFSRLYRRAWLVVIVSFHFVTLVAMNIFFWENLLLVLVIFGWGVWTSEGSARLGPADVGGTL